MGDGAFCDVEISRMGIVYKGVTSGQMWDFTSRLYLAEGVMNLNMKSTCILLARYLLI